MNLWTPLFFLAGTLLAHGQDGDEFTGARARAWFAQLNGQMQTADIELGTDISLDGDLGFGGREILPDFTAWVNIPFLPVLDRVNFAYWLGDFEETETLERTLTFGNQTFTLGTDLDSQVEFSLMSLSLEHFLLTSGNRDLGCTIGLLLGVKFVEATALLEAKDFGIREKQEMTAPFPVVGVHFLVHMTQWVTLEMELLGSGGKYGSLGGTYFEWFLEASYRPLDWIHVGIGYKAALFGMEDDSNDGFEAKIRLDGLFFSVGIQF